MERARVPPRLINDADNRDATRRDATRALGVRENKGNRLRGRKNGKTSGWRIEGRIEADVFRDRNAEEIAGLINPLISRDSYHVANNSLESSLRVARRTK